jgi:hypothetical protein
VVLKAHTRAENPPRTMLRRDKLKVSADVYILFSAYLLSIAFPKIKNPTS